MTMPRPISSMTICAGLAAVALAVTACGTNDGNGTPAAQGDGATQSDRTSTATGEPILVGFLNQSQGATAFPDFGAGAAPAVAHINANGGVNGRPLELKSCDTDGSPTASVNCANTFVQNNVTAVVMGIDLSSDSALPILEGADIPLIGHTSFGPKQSSSPNAFFFGAANDGYWASPIVALSQEYDVKSVAVVVEDSAFYRGYIEEATTPTAESLGVDLEVEYYSAATPNYTSSFAAATSDQPDAVLIYGSESQCTGLVSAGSTLGYTGKVFAGTCSAFIKSDPASAEGVLTNGDLYLPDDLSTVPDRQAEEVQTYVDAMEGVEPEYVNAFSAITFSGFMDFASALSGIDGEITPPAILQAIGGLRDAPSFMGQSISCDGQQWPAQAAVCTGGLITYEVRDGKRVPVTDFLSAAQYLK